MTEEFQDYLGDGVYVSFDGYHIWIGLGSSMKQIALEPAVFDALVNYRKRIQAHFDNKEKAPDE